VRPIGYRYMRPRKLIFMKDTYYFSLWQARAKKSIKGFPVIDFGMLCESVNKHQPSNVKTIIVVQKIRAL